MLNRQLIECAGDDWTDEAIAARTAALTESILRVWPTPADHRVDQSRDRERPKHRVEIADLVAAGLLKEGVTLYARARGVGNRTATVLSDGGLDVDGVRYGSPSGAALSVTGTKRNGWSYWLVDSKSRLSLADLWHQYVDQGAVDVDDSDAPDEDDQD
jgi:hypothetical protein